LGIRSLILRWGALEQSPHVVILANFLSAAGLGVTLLTVEDAARPPALSQEVEWLSLGRAGIRGARKLFALAGVAARARALARQRRPDFVHVIDSWTLPVPFMATLGQFQWSGPRFVYQTYDWLEPGLSSPIHRWYEKRACRAASLVINVDRSRARLMQTLYGLKTTPFWLPNFPSKYAAAPPRDARLREELLGRGGRYLVICPSAASPGRLHLELLRAFLFLPETYRLVTFGSPGRYLDSCLDFARAEGLETRIKFLDPVPYPTLEKYIACADIGIVLNDWKGSAGYWMANSGRLVSLLACGVPAVASDVPNLEALVYKWRLGTCCNAYDPRDIARAIHEVAEEGPGLEERRRLIQEAVARELHFERQGTLLVRTLEDLCRAPRRGLGGVNSCPP
jgi:glycosyltransferase involved in cell wall biosynthesis